MSKELLPELPKQIAEWYDEIDKEVVRTYAETGVIAYGQACYEAGKKAACVYQEAVDIELVNAHIGTAENEDTLEDARKKLSELIKWWESVGEYFADKKPGQKPSDEQLALGRQAVMALDCSGPSWTVRQHYQAAGHSTDGIPDYLLDMKCPMPKENRAELLWYAMHPSRLLAIIDGEKS